MTHRRWRTYILIRDGWHCMMCGIRPDLRYKLQAHHIYPKYKYPERATDLDNGVTLCSKCHVPVVHRDAPGRAGDGYAEFLPMFRRLMRLVKNRKYNEANQEK